MGGIQPIETTNIVDRSLSSCLHYYGSLSKFSVTEHSNMSSSELPTDAKALRYVVPCWNSKRL